MTTSTRALRTLLAGDELALVPGCHDALGALLIAEAGFPAAYMSGFSVAASLGKPDLGIIGLPEMAAQAGHIARAVPLPLIVDADTGYGGPLNVAESVRTFERAGAAGLHLEDQMQPKKCGAVSGKKLVPIEEMSARIRVARNARSDPDFVIIGRTDALTVHGLDETVRRVRAMADAGADAVMVPSLSTEAELAAIGRAVEVPAIYLTAETIRPLYTAGQLKAFGFAMAIFPISLIQIIVGAQRELLHELQRARSTAALVPKMASFAEVGRLVGLDAAAALERQLEEPGT